MVRAAWFGPDGMWTRQAYSIQRGGDQVPGQGAWSLRSSEPNLSRPGLCGRHTTLAIAHLLIWAMTNVPWWSEELVVGHYDKMTVIPNSIARALATAFLQCVEFPFGTAGTDAARVLHHNVQ